MQFSVTDRVIKEEGLCMYSIHGYMRKSENFKDLSIKFLQNVF